MKLTTDGRDNTARHERATVGIREAAQILGIGRNQAYQAARRGEIQTIRIGSRLLVSRRSIERMLDGRTTE
jgi:excisionase family DNA binding protein